MVVERGIACYVGLQTSSCWFSGVCYGPVLCCVPCTDELAYLLTPLVRGQFILPAERNQATMFLNTAPTLMSFLLVKVFFGGSGVALGTAHGCMDLTKACCTGISNS